MDHVIRISNKTCFSENKKARQYAGGKSTFDYILCWLFWKKKSIGCGGGGELIFYIQENCSFYLLYFQAKAGRLVFSKGIGETFIKGILFIQIKPIV